MNIDGPILDSKNNLLENPSKIKIIHEYAEFSYHSIFPIVIVLTALGGVLLLFYLNSIGHPEQFIKAINSSSGLVALSLGGAIASLMFGLTFLSPIYLAKFAMNIFAPKYPGADIHFSLIVLMFLGFCGLAIEINTKNFMNALVLFVIFSVIARFLYLFKYRKFLIKRCIELKTSNFIEFLKYILYILGDNIWRTLVLTLAVLLTSFPILLISHNQKINTDDTSLIASIIGYYLITLWIIYQTKKNKSLIIEVIVFLFLSAIVATLFNVQILNGLARIYGIRHDVQKWYWVENFEKISPILPDGVCQFSRDKGCYIHAFSPFFLGDSIVLCATASEDIKITDEKQRIENYLSQCESLSTSEVRLASKEPGLPKIAAKK
jgi:hypothetical protein